MSFRVLNTDGSNNTDVEAKTFSNLVPWVRNPSWPACEANTGDNRVRGLYAVWPGGGNFIAMTVSGAYTVEYGDGTTTNYAAGVTAYYEYDYNDADLANTNAPVTFTDSGDTVNRTSHGYQNGMTVQFYNIVSTTGITAGQTYYVINATTNSFQISSTYGGSAVALTTNGSGTLLPYKIATVTITPQVANNLTSVNLFVKHNQAGLVNGYSTGWLDLAFAASTITSLTISGVTSVIHRYLEQVKLNQLGAITSFSSLFSVLVALKNVVISDSITSVTATDSMFSACRNLVNVSQFNTASVTNMSSMFATCTELQTVPLLNTESVTNMTSMFQNCYNLQTVPLFNTAAVLNMTTMFQNCYSLQTVPLFNTAAVTNMSSMFSTCQKLKTVPLFNTASVTNMSSMFDSCYSLQTVPLFNTVSVTTMANMFANCSTLQTVPLFNTAAVTSMSGMFNSASVLTSVPLFNTAAVTTTSVMFLSCFNLQTVPLFNTASVTTMSSMFSGCSGLTSVPALVTTAVTSSGGFSGMFTSCSSNSRIEAKNFRFTFSVANNKLSATSLNEIYTNLPTVTAQTITVTGNFGTATDNPAIATAKGWTVTG